MEHSETLGKLAKALATFQAEVKDPARDGENPHFKSKYVPIDGLLAAVRPKAAKHGLSIVQSTVGNGQEIGVTTMILHESGEWLMTDALTIRPAQSNPQGCMSAVTYARRYSLSAALGVAWDDDDDGNAASTPPPKEAKQKTKAPAKQKEESVEPVEQVDAKAVAWHKVLETAKRLTISKDDIKEIVHRRYNKNTWAELTDAEATDVAAHLEDYAVELIDEEALMMGEK